jgi:hypothetical protein
VTTWKGLVASRVPPDSKVNETVPEALVAPTLTEPRFRAGLGSAVWAAQIGPVRSARQARSDTVLV